MKQTKLAEFVIGLVFLFSISVKGSEALDFFPRPLVTKVPSPTPIIVKKVDVDLLKVVDLISPTPTPIIIKKIIDPNLIKVLTTVTPTPTESVSVTPALTESPTAEPTVTVAKEVTVTIVPEKTTKDNLTLWFLIITIGLLAVIIVIQAWPKKNDEG